MTRDGMAPIRVALGIGCERGASLETLAAMVDQALASAGLGRPAVRVMATIDRKRDEPAIGDLAALRGWPLRYFSAAALAEVEVARPSARVQSRTGTPAVSEAAALLAAGADRSGLLVEKQKRRGSDGKWATVAIARMVDTR